MRPTPPLEISVVRKEDKEGKLHGFIKRELELRRNAGVQPFPHGYVAIARSLDSPVAKALLGLGADAVAIGTTMRVLLMLDDPHAHEAAPDALGLMDCRVMGDQRLLDAHELLVIGPAMVWIGDCMRRDPAKRDAYEFYSETSVETAGSALRSFERLWRMAAPLAARRPSASMPEAAVIAAETATATAEAATRH